MSTEKFILDEESISEFAKKALLAVKTEVSPEELNEYRKIFRKSVPFTMRSYVAAYLIREALPKTDFSRPNRNTTDRSIRKHSNPRVFLSPEVSTSLFISIGKKRRVFPKDIITLIMKNVEVPRENIGEIKILDNYSFVQVMNDNAEEIISKLNNFFYRGKPLAVSYAHNGNEDKQTDELSLSEVDSGDSFNSEI